MKKALIVKYTENNVEYWGYYYKRYFNATYFETSLELKFYLKDLEIEWENRYVTINFDTDKEQKREICKSFYSEDYKLGYAETLIEKYMSFKYLAYGIPKGESYRSAIFMDLDELEEEVNYYRAILKIKRKFIQINTKALTGKKQRIHNGKDINNKDQT